MSEKSKFRRPTKVYVLKFVDEEFEGLEVRAGSMPIGELLELSALADEAAKKDNTAIRRLFDLFCEHLISWNVVDGDDRDVPANIEGIYSLEADFAMKIITSWMEAVAGVPGPLNPPSSDGSPSLEAGIPTAAL